MSELKFKAYGELEISEALSDASHVIIEENGDVKRFPANSIGKVKTVNGAEPDESGNVAVQPDFSQNDPTAPDYVKNRPFYTGDPVETVLVKESTVSFVTVEGLYAAEFPSTFEATVGVTYTVTWDGTAYECTCVDLNGIPFIGNMSIAGFGSDTGEPFCMAVFNGNGIGIATADTSASHTFSISGLVQEVVKIDEKYLPEIPVEKLPEIPVEKLPEIPVEKLPEILVEKLPEIPVIELTENIIDSIASDTQPSYTVKNISYSDLLEIFNRGIFAFKDSYSMYYPLKTSVNTSGNLSATIFTNEVLKHSLVYATLVCSNGKTVFYRNNYRTISETT